MKKTDVKTDVKNDEKIAFIIPTITINGVTYQPLKSPKARMWRKIVTLYEQQKDMDAGEYMDQMAGCIAAAFGRPEVTADDILDNIALDDMLDLLDTTYLWFGRLLNQKYASMQKNAQAGTAS